MYVKYKTPLALTVVQQIDACTRFPSLAQALAANGSISPYACKKQESQNA
jgi:hypothetical protein